MSNPFLPHGGGPIIQLLVEKDNQDDFSKKAQTLTKIKMSSWEKWESLMFSMGAYNPYGGFVGEAD